MEEVGTLIHHHHLGSSSGRLLTPTKSRKSQTRISDDSDNPLSDALVNQIPTSDRRELLKRAIAIANLNGKKSTASQSLERALWREIDTQIYLPVETAMNTRKSTSVDTDHPLNTLKKRGLHIS
jgi:hypothetical protein